MKKEFLYSVIASWIYNYKRIKTEYDIKATSKKHVERLVYDGSKHLENFKIEKIELKRQ